MPIPGHARGYEDFPGTVGRTSDASTPWWPAERTPPAGAPNIVVVLVDDMGFSDIAPFGAEIDTPVLGRLAAEGVRLTNFHVAPVCSPSRAALLTGLNPHRAGYGGVANSDVGYPGMRLELADDVVSLPEALQGSGYATFAVGKWHLTRDANLAPGRSKDSWPLQRGFDHYYGSMEGFNSFFHPNQLVRDNSPVDMDEYPDGYYLTDDLTDNAVRMIKDLRAGGADSPFFLYFAHVAMHAPLQAKEEDIDRHRGSYDDGWDALRERRFRNQLDLGLFPPGTTPADRNTESGLDVDAWADLPAPDRDRMAKYMEVYAAMVDTVDRSLGRIVETLEELGELENTVIVFTSDNGASAEGGAAGTRSYLSQFVHRPVPDDWNRDVALDPQLIGSATHAAHYPRGWAQASNTPFRLYKGQTYAGGVRAPLIVSWPAGLPAQAHGAIRPHYSYMTDLMPTLLDLAGVAPPESRKGLPAKDPDGVSIAGVLRGAAATSPHREQYSEYGGHRGYYRDGWKLLAFHEKGSEVDDPRWRLYDNDSDPAETRDVAADHPELVRDLAAAWDRAAWRNTVFPLLQKSALALPRRPEEDKLARPTRILAGASPLERYRSAQLIQYRDWRATAELPGFEPGDRGVLFAHGDLMGGYLLYVEDDRLVVAYNAYGEVRHSSTGPIPTGARELTLRAQVAPGLRWDLTLEIDGADAATLDGCPQLVGMAPWTGISVGRDARGPVDPRLRERHGTWPYTGALAAVRYLPGGQRVDEDTVRGLRAEAAALED